ncbi:MAG: HAD family hydrolase [Sphingomonas sp.]
MPAEPKHARTIVFDLDDTLFAERDYVRSGLRAVATMIERLHGIAIAIDSLPAIDPLGALRRRAGLPEAALDSLLWAYRLHPPVIATRPGAAETLAACRGRGEAVAVLTDGRSATQRLKIDALGLTFDGIFVSEEIGATKPSPAGYRAVERALPASNYVYIADNPSKDFIAPNAHGWLTIGLRPGEDAIHRHDEATLPDGAAPAVWTTDFSEIAAVLAATAINAPFDRVRSGQRSAAGSRAAPRRIRSHHTG